MPAAPLEIVNLTAGYGPTRVIEGLSLSVPSGSRFAVLGRNGVGKTSLFATLAGQTKRFSGDIRIGGRRLAPCQVLRAPRPASVTCLRPVTCFRR